MELPSLQHDEPERTVAVLFASGFNCAESVVEALAPSRGPGSDRPRVQATGFGGGLARHGLTCGALSGAVMALSALAGRSEADDDAGRERVYRMVDGVLQRFARRFGSLDCRRVTGLDFGREEDRATFDRRVKDAVCLPLVAFVVQSVLAELEAAGRPAP